MNTNINPTQDNSKLYDNRKRNFIKIKIANANSILSKSYGEVKKPDTINYKTFKPERGGLFCTVIFGTDKDYECTCGKYKGKKFKGIVCDKCGVEVTTSKKRRERSGHITLNSPVVNINYLLTPSKLAIALDIPQESTKRIVYHEDYLILDPGVTPLKKLDILNYQDLCAKREEFGEDSFVASTGAEAIKEVLQNIDIVQEINKCKLILRDEKMSELKAKNIKRRCDLLEDFHNSGNALEDMIITHLPVMPPDLRPLVALDGGRFAASELNHLYLKIINANNRQLKTRLAYAPDVIQRNEKRALQCAVDALFNNSSSPRVVRNALGRPLKSISDFLKGKQGRFRQNLLGKRVDYSGRSVIVVGPELKLHQCGIPKIMALELFKPFIASKLCLQGYTSSVKLSLKMIDEKSPEVWDILEEIVKEHPVLLNRAPTLHRLGIQAFEVKLTESKAIELHPLVCRAFNADFDGDQMAVHVPLSIESQMEARVLIFSTNNIINVANGECIVSPRKDITAGLYYLTLLFDDNTSEDNLLKFYSDDDIDRALENNIITIHTKIKYYFKYEGDINYTTLVTTPGRTMLFRIIPKDKKVDMSIFNTSWSINNISEILDIIYKVYGKKMTVIFSDKIMSLGFKYITKSGLSIGKDDITVPINKQEIIASTLEEIKEHEKKYESGITTKREKFNQVTDSWFSCVKRISEEMMKLIKLNQNNKNINSILLMMNSGARASETQLRQVAGMRGLIVKPSGEIIETPVVSNFKEGLTVLEYFTSANGARKGNVDTALKTADAGYLTRRFAEVAQDCIVTEEDCHTDKFIICEDQFNDGKIIRDVYELANHKVTAKDILDSESNLLLSSGTLIGHNEIELLKKHNIRKVFVRSPVTCEATIGICRKCYGTDLSSGALVDIGEAVGIIAAQSIGEPGTQLTLRTFHIGGAASKKIVDQKVKSSVSGQVIFQDIEYVENITKEKICISNNGKILIKSQFLNVDVVTINVEYGSKLFINHEDFVNENQILFEWDPYNKYIFSEFDATVSFEDLVINSSYSDVIDEAIGSINKVVINSSESTVSLSPNITLLSEDGEVIKDKNGYELKYYLSIGTILAVEDKMKVKKGDILAKIPRDSLGLVSDITGGLPRLEEIFEARVPKDYAVIAAKTGFVCFESKSKLKNKIILYPEDGSDSVSYNISKSRYIQIRNGCKVRAGDTIAHGDLNLSDILKFQGVSALTNYILSQVHLIYKVQGIEINSKHIEVIVRSMLRKVKVSDQGDSALFKVGDIYDLSDILEENMKLKSISKSPVVFEHMIYGITKSAINSKSFIAAASFQETLKVLTDAAIKGKTDYLTGLKENIIIGGLIPAGTGFFSNRE